MERAGGQQSGQIVKPAGFPSWISYFPGAESAAATVLFPHAGGASVSYRAFAAALAAQGDVYIVQYPQRADRYREPAPETLHQLAVDLFDAAPWAQVGPLRLFGHSMGSLVAFEFARIAEERGVAVPQLWVSAGPAPVTVAGKKRLPTDHVALLDELAGLGGTDPRLLADDEFARMFTGTLGVDYAAMNRYACAGDVTVHADIHALGGRLDDRVDVESIEQWAQHTVGEFSLAMIDGGHFYINDNIPEVVSRMGAAG